MQIIHLNLANLISLPALALTIGNYDGVHLGHQAMLSALKHSAKVHKVASAVMVFEPQPREFFCPDDPPPRLSSLAEKAKLMAQLGIDYLLVARFDDEFRSLSADEFTHLLKALNVVHLVLGDDFRFGHDRIGDAYFLKQAGFSVDELSTVLGNNQRISSTAIRQALACHDFATASSLLGRDYAITGKVVHGDKIGRTLDFATANIALERPRPALSGIYGADIFVFDGDVPLDWSIFGQQQGVRGLREGSLFGAVNIGTRPSVAGRDYRLEVHLPNFTGDLYGLTLKVVFLTYLHGEKKYASLDELKQGIATDVADLLAWRSRQV